jgi:hypothetical protein
MSATVGHPTLNWSNCVKRDGEVRAIEQSEIDAMR